MKTSKLEEILGIDFPQECKISSVTNTSKKIKKGSIFFGLQGTNEHGSNYALEALDIGALFVVHNDKNLQTNNKRIFYIENLENKIVKFLDSFYGININNTSPILKEAIKMGGTELLRANLATGNALPWAIIMKIKMNKCLSGNFFD